MSESYQEGKSLVSHEVKQQITTIQTHLSQVNFNHRKLTDIRNGYETLTLERVAQFDFPENRLLIRRNGVRKTLVETWKPDKNGVKRVTLIRFEDNPQDELNSTYFRTIVFILPNGEKEIRHWYTDPETKGKDALSMVISSDGQVKKVEFPTNEESQFQASDLPQLQEIDLSMRLLAKAFH